MCTESSWIFNDTLCAVVLCVKLPLAMGAVSSFKSDGKVLRVIRFKSWLNKDSWCLLLRCRLHSPGCFFSGNYEVSRKVLKVLWVLSFVACLMLLYVEITALKPMIRRGLIRLKVSSCLVFLVCVKSVLKVDSTILESPDRSEFHSENKHFKSLLVILQTDLTKHEFRCFCILLIHLLQLNHSKICLFWDHTAAVVSQINLADVWLARYSEYLLILRHPLWNCRSPETDGEENIIYSQ